MQRTPTISDISLANVVQRDWCGPDCPLRKLQYVLQDAAALNPIRLDEDAFVAGEDGNNTHQNAMADQVFTPLRGYQTRLIALNPGVGDAPIECNLVTVDLIDGRGCAIAGSDAVVTYEAISYSWGRSKASCIVMINGHVWGVSEELANALLYLRKAGVNRYLWCDALCINQENLVEKAAQIKSMLRIFEKAERVLAWLGKPVGYAERLCNAFHDIDDNVETLMQQQHDAVCREVVESLEMTLRHYLESQWFLRTWIRQEVFAAKELILHFGSHELDFRLFLDRLEAIHQICNPAHNFVRTITIPPTFQTLRREYQHLGTDNPSYTAPREQATFVIHTLKILRSGSLFQVSNERDRIYGMLGILTSQAARFEARLPDLPDRLAVAYPVDYTQSEAVVFEHMIKYLINQTCRLGILDVFRYSHDNSQLASWAIDWRNFRPDSSSVFVVFDSSRFYDEKTPRELLPFQEYNNIGRLNLIGVRAVGKLSRINGLKEMDHPRHRLNGNANTDLRFSDFFRPRPHMVEQTERMKLRIVAARFEEERGNHQLHLITRALWKEGAAIEQLTSDYYAFAYTDERSVFRLHKFHYLVPRHASLEDMIVSFCGSMWLQLIRKVRSNPDEYIYLGPVAAVISESELEQEFDLRSTSTWNRHTSEVKGSEPEARKFRRQTFVLH